MRRSRTILLVEDNLEDVELTLRAFAQNQIANDIAVARDGEEALDYLFCRGAHVGREPLLPELVLLDLKLPKIDGLEVLQAIRADPVTRRLPVVMLTASNQERDIIASYDLGANSFVQKPVGFAEFLEAVRHLGLYWLVVNEPPPLEGA